MKYQSVTNKKSYGFIANLQELDKKELKVGWFKNLRYENGEYVAAIAAQNEFGNAAKNIPARPFMRPTVAREQNNWSKLITNLSRQVAENKRDANDGLTLLGLKVSADIRESIKQVVEPPLSPVTIANRLSKRKNQKIVGMLDKPLIDTSQMIDSVNYEISDG